ncbi:MAG: hypothetical protein EBU08_17730 [Micrococcales bacterium]|jgi:hypothetical protein|nr:hypothetical protein [Micrococcales bacterium]
MENKMKAKTKTETKMNTVAWDWFIARYTKMGYKSLNQFAIATGLQKSSLSRYFHRQRQMPSGMMATLCRELKVTPNELMRALGEWQ